MPSTRKAKAVANASVLGYTVHIYSLAFDDARDRPDGDSLENVQEVEKKSKHRLLIPGHSFSFGDFGREISVPTKNFKMPCKRNCL